MQLPKRKPPKYSSIPTDLKMSQEKYDEMVRKRDGLQKKQPAAAREVSRLAEMGDFSENVEYQLAKRRLRGILSGITKLTYQIDHAQVIEKKDDGTVQIGSTVTFLSDKGMRTYTILGEAEADPTKGIISHESPIGAALIGCKIGDSIDVEPLGTIQITSVE